MSLFTQNQIQNYNDDRIVIVIFELPSVHTIEKALPNFMLSIPVYVQHSRAERRSVARFCVLITISFMTEFILENARFIGGSIMVRNSCSSAPPPPPQNHNLEVQCIHMAIALHDLRDTSLQNTSGPSFELRNSNYPCDTNLHTHGPKYHNLTDP